VTAPRVVFETSAGDLVLALRPDASPRQVERFLALVRAGVYDSASIERVDPTLYLRISPAGRRRLPLSPKQLELVSTPRAPIEAGLPHEYGVVTVAHAAGESDDTGTGLAILTARMPGMDGRFSSFAVVERGQGVLEYARGVPCGPDHAPIERLEIARAYALDAAKAGALALREPPRARRFDALPGGILALAGLLALLAARRRGPRAAALLAILAGFFCLLVALGGGARGSAWLGTALFAGAIAVFRLMSSFEAAS